MPLGSTRKNWPVLLVCLAIAALTCLIYAQVGDHHFLAYDDDIYITNNPHIKEGLTLGGVRWAFTSIYESNWIPLTWISHMLDVQLFGLAPAGHHLTNLALHLLNTLLLFLLFRTMTAALWRPALLALLFAVHPLHVESVAWAAERKDLLCGLFFILTLYFYAQYLLQDSPARYLLALLSFLLGLLAKPMIVSLPLVLILLDQWPLARSTRPGDATKTALLDKLPFCLGSIAIAVLTLIAQTAGGSLASMGRHPLPERLLNAAVSYLAYLGKILLPINLSVFYPYPEPSVPLWQAAAALLLLGAITFLAWRRFTGRPYLLVGWLWFTLTLVPVIGVVQVGEQAMADRYAYLPIVGILVVLVWGGEELWRRYQPPLAASRAAVLLVLAVLTLLAKRQTGYWQDQYTLFQHSLAVTDRNYLASLQVGNALVMMNRLTEAREYFIRSIGVQPTAKAYNNLAYTEERTGLSDQAAGNYRRAIELDPNNIEAHYNLGLLLVRQWHLTEAIRQFEVTLQLDPTHLKARQNLAKAELLLKAGQGRN